MLDVMAGSGVRGARWGKNCTTGQNPVPDQIRSSPTPLNAQQSPPLLTLGPSPPLKPCLPRYLQQAGADEVWCNDLNPSNRPALVHNLCSAASVPIRDQGSPATLGTSGHSRLEESEGASTPSLSSSSRPGNQVGLSQPVQLTPEQKIEAWIAQAESVQPPGLKRPAWQWTAPRPSAPPPMSSSPSSPLPAVPGDRQAAGGQATVRVSHLDAHRLLCR